MWVFRLHNGFGVLRSTGLNSDFVFLKQEAIKMLQHVYNHLQHIDMITGNCTDA